MASMFENCYSLTSLDLSHLITDDVTDMKYAFHNCSSLQTLLVSFRTLNVRYMQHLFSDCTSLKTLNIGTFFTANVNNLTDMFENDEGLELYYDFKL